jgi:dipeptidyl aminopeptidase/acylaminoacyl peptidase
LVGLKEATLQHQYDAQHPTDTALLMKLQHHTRALVLTLCALLTACSTVATHPSLRQPTDSATAVPPLVPVRQYVADWDGNGGHQISPDGQRLLWLARKGLRQGLFVKDFPSGRVQSIGLTGFPMWAEDSRHILVMRDGAGDENVHVFQYDSTNLEAGGRDLTPFAGARSHVHSLIQDSADLLIVSNRRDPKVFDLYRHEQVSGELKLVSQNPGDVLAWITNQQGQLLGRVRQTADERLFETANAQAPGGWKNMFSVGLFDTVAPLRVGKNNEFLWALSNRGRDKLALVKINLDTGAEEVVAQDPRVDLSSALISQKTLQPLMWSADPGHQELQIFEPRLQALIARLKARHPGPLRFHVTSISRDERLFTATTSFEGGGQHLLYDANTDAFTVLGESTRSRVHASSPLPQQSPIQFTSRDGLTLHGYLTLPAGAQPRQLPTVLYVHGGPWARDYWAGGDPMPYFLANRGYAVLQVNYRGSSGYGRAFQDAARGEFAAKMHDDLIDGVDHLVAQGITDPNKTAIMGASYGGYATLVGMTFTPERFSCGVSLVGMSDLASLLANTPPYWELGKPWWVRFVGDPVNARDRAVMESKSPLYRAKDVRGPVLLLHGVNDPRVKLDQSTRMADALKAAGKEVELVVYKSAGHGFQKWNDKLSYYRHTEDFLSRCLGGRSSGFDWYQLGSWAF